MKVFLKEMQRTIKASEIERGWREHDSAVKGTAHRCLILSAGFEVVVMEGNRIEERSALRVHPNGGRGERAAEVRELFWCHSPELEGSFCPLVESFMKCALDFCISSASLLISWIDRLNRKKEQTQNTPWSLCFLLYCQVLSFVYATSVRYLHAVGGQNNGNIFTR